MFKVRCKLISFEKDEKKHPCHFNYKIGDEFYYDGVHFTGRICPGLLASMTPIIHGVYLLGNKCSENIMYRYRGLDARDPSMARYDGVGFRPLKSSEKDADQAGEEGRTGQDTEGPFWTDPRTGKSKGAHFLCGDNRILAHFKCEAVDLSESEYAQPFYRRGIAILEKIEAEPGIRTTEILGRFTQFEREEIVPPLTPPFTEVMLDALEDVNYIEIRDGRAYATGKEPPTRPRIGQE
jgi:uncharacterized repeat protein (TIGR04076 family)